MSDKPELNGIKLGVTGTSVSITAHSNSLRVRQGREAIHGGTEHREKLGNDLPEINITFTIVGHGSTKYSIADFIVGTLEDDEVWSLQTSALNNNHFIYRDVNRIACSTVSVSHTVNSRVNITVQATAIINGIWIADGGTYCETINGNFTLQSTGPNVFIRDDGTNTGSTPLVRLPEQTSGYPLAVKASDFSQDTPAASGAEIPVLTEDGNTIYFQDYDMTGYLIPAPSTAGDVGLYEICSSPTDEFLSGGEGIINPITAGMASGAMASAAMTTV